MRGPLRVDLVELAVDLVLQDYRCWSRGSGGKVEPGRCRAVGGSQGLVASSKRELGGRVDPSERSDERAWVWSGTYNQCPRKRAGSPGQQSSLTLRNRLNQEETIHNGVYHCSTQQRGSTDHLYTLRARDSPTGTTASRLRLKSRRRLFA